MTTQKEAVFENRAAAKKATTVAEAQTAVAAHKQGVIARLEAMYQRQISDAHTERTGINRRPAVAREHEANADALRRAIIAIIEQ